MATAKRGRIQDLRELEDRIAAAIEDYIKDTPDIGPADGVHITDDYGAEIRARGEVPDIDFFPLADLLRQDGAPGATPEIDLDAIEDLAAKYIFV